MLPILFNIGGVPISAFGLFLALSLVSSLFVVWRLAKAYDLNEERITNITILTFLGALVGARVLAIALNWAVFDSWEKMILVNRYPGLTFWGGLIGGALTFIALTLRSKFNLWQLADFAGVGLLLGMVVGDLGCFLAGCGYGIISDSVIATPVTGLVGKRLPVSLLESLAILLIFTLLWRQTIRFHFSGKIISQTLIFLGSIKLLTEFYRGDSQSLFTGLMISYGLVLSVLLQAVGVTVFYWRCKRNPVTDIRLILEVFHSPKRRSLVLATCRRSWYNFTVSWRLRLAKTVKALKLASYFIKRRLNVKPTPEDFR